MTIKAKLTTTGGIPQSGGGLHFATIIFLLFFGSGLYVGATVLPAQKALYKDLTARGVRTSGEVTGFTYRKKNSSSSSNHVTTDRVANFRFSDNHGEIRTGSARVGPSFGGSSIPVVYDPLDPSRFQAGVDAPRDSSAGLLVLVSVFSLVGAGGALFCVRSILRRKALLTRGRVVQGEIVDVYEQRYQKKQRRHLYSGLSISSSNYTYSLVVRWRASGESAERTTISDPVATTPPSLQALQGKPLNVVYLPENPKVSMVDLSTYS
jgi:hypothetical protein